MITCGSCGDEIEDDVARWYAEGDDLHERPLYSVRCWRVESGYVWNVVTQSWRRKPDDTWRG